MDNIVSFNNKGILDAMAIGTFGVNAKSSDSAIGYFGTGLKYAIAVLLREDCDIVILAGSKEYNFTKVSTEMRGKSFDVIHMNGEPLGFTTELGKKWKMWQAFRELYCNALDEDGIVAEGMITHVHDETTVQVTGAKFYDCYLDRGKIVLETDVFIKNDLCNIHRGSNSHIYFKGVRIYDGFNPSLYTYNVQRGLDITEDRTAAYNFQIRSRVATAIATSKNSDFIEEVLLAEQGYFEHGLEYDDSHEEPSETFLELAEKHRLNIKVNTSIFKVLAKHNRLPKIKKVEINKVQKVMVQRAIAFCKKIGYAVDAYPIVISDQLKSGLHGLAENSTIYISPDTLGMGTKYLASTLIEEYLHLHTGYGDMTRELQSHLFNDIVSLGEQLLGEPV